MYKFMLILVLSAMMGFQAWRILLNNFAVDTIGLDGLKIGVVQSLREVPGFLVFLVVFILIFIKEHKFASYSVILMGIGILLTGIFPSFLGLIITTIIMSTGFHYYETTNKSLTLQYFNKTESPIVFAKLRSLSAAGNIFIGGIIWLASDNLPYWVTYMIIGVLVIIAGIFTLRMNPIKKKAPRQNKKLIIKKEYWLYYVLNFLGGARRQIFVVFAVFLLVDKYNFTVKEIAILFIINNIVAFFINPIIGKSINKFGERKVLSVEYIGLIFIFLGYALLDNRWIIAVLYIVDHIFYNFSIGINTYLQKIAKPEDIAPSTSMGFAINHITAVIIPVLGGIMWLQDYKITFEIGVILSVISLGFVQLIKVVKNETETIG